MCLSITTNCVCLYVFSRTNNYNLCILIMFAIRPWSVPTYSRSAALSASTLALRSSAEFKHSSRNRGLSPFSLPLQCLFKQVNQMSNIVNDISNVKQSNMNKVNQLSNRRSFQTHATHRLLMYSVNKQTTHIVIQKSTSLCMSDRPLAKQGLYFRCISSIWAVINTCFLSRSAPLWPGSPPMYKNPCV